MIISQLPTVALFGFKILLLVGLGVYTIFAMVMMQQTRLMTNVFNDSFETVLKIISLFHLVAAIALLLLATVIL